MFAQRQAETQRRIDTHLRIACWCTAAAAVFAVATVMLNVGHTLGWW